MGARERLLLAIGAIVFGAVELFVALQPPRDLVAAILGALLASGGVYGVLTQPKGVGLAREVTGARHAASEAYFHGSRKQALDALNRLILVLHEQLRLESSETYFKGHDWDTINGIRNELPLIHARMAKLCRDWGDEDGFRRHAGAAMTSAADIRMSPPLNYVDDVYAYAVREDGLTSGKKSLA